jgi:transcription-repair coupling factor (superfamily II helicase)
MSSLLTDLIYSQLSQSNKSIIVGYNDGALCYLLGQLARRFRNLFVLSSNWDLAQALRQKTSDLCELIGSQGQGSTRFQYRLLGFPPMVTSPYSGLLPSIALHNERLKSLVALTTGLAANSGEASNVIFTTAQALGTKVPTLNFFKNNSLHLAVGQRYDRGNILSKLNQLGYKRVDIVDAPGSYATRGFILDIYPSGFDYPIRLEFFDDEIESIRPFEEENQTSLATRLDEAKISPYTFWCLDPAGKEQISKNLKIYCDDHGISKVLRESLIDRLMNNDYNAADLKYHSIIDPQNDTFLSIVNNTPDSLVVLVNPADLQAAHKSYVANLTSDYAKSTLDILVEPELIYNSTQELSDLKLPTLISDGLLASAEDAAIIRTTALTTALQSDINGSQPKITQFIHLVNGLLLAEYQIFLCSKSKEDNAATTAALKRHGLDLARSKHITCLVADLSESFVLEEDRIAFFNTEYIYGYSKKEGKPLSRDSRLKEALPVTSLKTLRPGDLLIQFTHGLGIYKGLVPLRVGRTKAEFLLLEYSGGDKLYLPVYRLDTVQKYLGSAESNTLDKLGSQQFEKTKEKIKSALYAVADELLALYAERAVKTRVPYQPEGEDYFKFCEEFPYVETSDQESAIAALLADFKGSKIIDRLVCGDVGFGKTEVAMRAAYRAISEGQQVAVLVPTTILAFQHEKTFQNRFKNTPFVIESLSRFKSAKERKEVLERLSTGAIDVCIGTHRLLSKDVVFKNLGLLIVDEEHRFGVEHKEKLKDLKKDCDTITLTATPIPRTLQLSLHGLREISVINTPPASRLSVKTFVSSFDPTVVRKAINEELARSGQVFYVHNRVQTLPKVYDRLKSLVPEARIVVAHAQMNEGDLESRMIDFINKKYDILLCTSIIESGIDIPSANTIFIDQAHTLGLAQLYQLRGRVGRSHLDGRCYLLISENATLSAVARERLEAMQRFADLGSGFHIASKDLEMRGGGNILGKSQSGHINSVGYEMYLDLLNDAILERRGLSSAQKDIDPEISTEHPAYIPETYIAEPSVRLDCYKRLAETKNDADLSSISAEFQDRFGAPPPEVTNLLFIIRIKQLLKKHRVTALTEGSSGLTLQFAKDAPINHDVVLGLFHKSPTMFKLIPPSSLFVSHRNTSLPNLHAYIADLLSKVATS